MPPLKGASLYSGIFDDVVEPQSAFTPSTSATVAEKREPESKTPAAWSAALRFAPRKTAAGANKNKPRPNAALLATFSAASAVDPPATPSVTVTAPGKPPIPAINVARPSSALAPAPEIASTSAPTALLQQPSVKLVSAPVLVAPPTTLPTSVLEKDRALARAAAEARGDHRPRQDDFAPAEEDEDVNGFLASAAGKKATKKKNKRKRDDQGPNMDADYDPRIPNDYPSYKELVRKRRQEELEQQKQGTRYEEDDWDQEDEKEEWSEKRQRMSRFAPPSTYAASRPAEEVVEHASQPPPATITSGEEAYARRAAMTAEEAYQKRLATTDLATRQSAAAAIAARLAQAAPREEPPAAAVDPHTFASRLMTKYGHVAGTSLGTSGLLTPLTTETTSKGRGTIVHHNLSPNPFGITSEIILLENMISPSDESEEGLAEDIGTECAKFGYVQRVLPLFSTSRVLVQFTGVAGAYKAVRGLDGRFFGGKTVRARYYPRQEFDKGIYDA